MPLLVVPLAPDEVGLLTLREYDEIVSRKLVVFENGAHPLVERLRGMVEVRFDGIPPDVSDDDAVFVADPSSTRPADLARAGAAVTAGPADPPDSLSAAHAARVVRRAAGDLANLVVVMARLRSPDGCPWDREQDHKSLTVYLVEEAAEVLDAVDRDALGAELEEELGDVLLQVFFHAQVAADEGRFDVGGIARTIVAKLVHRHPHVFGDAVVEDAAEVVANWEAIKERERGGRRDASTSLLEGIPASLSALLAAQKAQKRAAGRGFRPDADEAAAEIRAALNAASRAGAEGDSAAVDRAIGDLLFAAAALARARGVDPEGALRRATRRFAGAMPPGEGVADVT